nr:MAG TPA: hypothetical protein [Caudoviricetes sp.]
MGKLFPQKNPSNALSSHSVCSILYNRSRRRKWV